MKPKIIGTGLSGMVGSRIVELLSDHYEFEDLSLKKGVDITNKEVVQKRICFSPARIVLHLAAKTNVDGCEEDKEKDLKILNQKVQAREKYFRKSKTAWAVNVEGTRNIVEACMKSNKRLIYISTDFVFDGKKPLFEKYTEEDTPAPINWYGRTKLEGEKIVQKLKTSFLILRIAFPFRSFFPQKKDFVRGILDKFRKKEKIAAVSNQIITPTFIDDLAYALGLLIEKKAVGLYHLVGSQSLSPLEAVWLIGSEFGLDKHLIKAVKIESYYQGRAPRPKNLAIKNEKVKELGIRMRGFKESLKEVKRQILKIEMSS